MDFGRGRSGGGEWWRGGDVACGSALRLVREGPLEGAPDIEVILLEDDIDLQVSGKVLFRWVDYLERKRMVVDQGGTLWSRGTM